MFYVHINTEVENLFRECAKQEPEPAKKLATILVPWDLQVMFC